MKRVAFVFKSAPHGTSAGREGLDALLATSALSDNPGVFFIGDGVMQILGDQKPAAILARDYIATFKVLPLYDIDDCMVCEASLTARGLGDATFVIDADVLAPEAWRARLAEFDVVFTF